MSELCDKTAEELLGLIRSREVSPVDLVNSCIARIEAANPAVNAIVATDFERAVATAKRLENEIALGNARGDLLGLPIAIKDLTETGGLRTTFGSRRFADHVPDQDEPLVAALRRQGAIVLAKTNTPEFGAGASTINDVYGTTGNPHASDRTPGGSSGGSAAALALSMVPLATGSDFGGSLRIPAAFCGVVGMRPSPGLVPSDRRSMGVATLWADGPMARTVADATLLLEAMARYDTIDPLSEPRPPAHTQKDGRQSKPAWRVAFSEDLGFTHVDAHIRRSFRGVADYLASHFLPVTCGAIDMAGADTVFDALRAESLLADFADVYRKAPAGFGANLQRNLAHALNLSAADIATAHARRGAMYRSFQRLFDDIDFLICPATAVSPFARDQWTPTTVEGRPPVSYFSWYALTYALSLTGHPVISIPCGRDADGLPLGIQICGPRRGDRQVLDIAKEIERLFEQTTAYARPHAKTS